MQVNRIVTSKSMHMLRGLALTATAFSILWLVADSARAGDGLPGGSPAVNSVPAEASAVKSLDEVMHMRIRKVKGKRVSAKGRSVGTVAGKVSFNLVLSNGSHATAGFFGRSSQGTISGTGVASYRVAGPVSYYNGTVTGLSGTGRYAHLERLSQFSHGCCRPL
jgi:hypothetical protein